MPGNSFVCFLLFFFIYGFIGWCFESTLVSITQRKWTNRGFIKGPFLPLYGLGAILILFATQPAKGNVFLIFLYGMLAATILEFVTGVCMEFLFKIRYWDYSKNKFQYKGHISLMSSLAWGAFSVLLVSVIHRPVAWLVSLLPFRTMGLLVFVLFTVFVADFTLSFKTAIDLRNILEKAEHIKMELQKIKKRLEILESSFENTRTIVEELVKEKTELLETRFRTENILQYFKENISRDKLSLLRRNPTARSQNYEEELAAIKNKIKKKGK